MSDKVMPMQILTGSVTPAEAALLEHQGKSPDDFVSLQVLGVTIESLGLNPSGHVVMATKFIIPPSVFKAHRPRQIVDPTGKSTDPVTVAGPLQIRMLVGRDQLQAGFLEHIDKMMAEAKLANSGESEGSDS